MAVIVLLAMGADGVRDALRYEQGVWTATRLGGAHLVHLAWSHTLLNAAGLAVLGLLFSHRLRWYQWWLAAVFSAVAIDLGLALLSTEIGWYVGLSGVLHGLFVVGSVSEWRDGHRSGLYLLVGVVAKLIYEQGIGPLPMTASAAGGPVVVDAHLYGALGGLVSCGLMRRGGPVHRRESGESP
ncbi:MAG: rhombosortase [Pseudomonadota bacterium]